MRGEEISVRDSMTVSGVYKALHLSIFQTSTSTATPSTLQHFITSIFPSSTLLPNQLPIFKMQFTTALAILIAATGISAAPTEEKRITSVQLEIFAGASCGSPTPITTATIITDGVCRPIGVPPFSGNTDAGFLLNSLPAGCTRK
jgi:hypothetical protein